MKFLLILVLTFTYSCIPKSNTYEKQRQHIKNLEDLATMGLEFPQKLKEDINHYTSCAITSCACTDINECTAYLEKGMSIAARAKVRMDKWERWYMHLLSLQMVDRLWSVLETMETVYYSFNKYTFRECWKAKKIAATCEISTVELNKALKHFNIDEVR